VEPLMALTPFLVSLAISCRPYENQDNFFRDPLPFIFGDRVSLCGPDGLKLTILSLPPNLPCARITGVSHHVQLIEAL
jgi:hypothetical protein